MFSIRSVGITFLFLRDKNSLRPIFYGTQLIGCHLGDDEDILTTRNLAPMVTLDASTVTLGHAACHANCQVQHRFRKMKKKVQDHLPSQASGMCVQDYKEWLHLVVIRNTKNS